MGRADIPGRQVLDVNFPNFTCCCQEAGVPLRGGGEHSELDQFSLVEIWDGY